MKKEILRLDHVSVYNKTNEALLENLNFTLFEGEINCVLTKEDLSKETLIHILQGKHSPDDGHLYINDKEIITGRDCKKLSSVSSHISIEPQLVSNMTVAENLFYFSKEFYFHGILNEKAIYENTRCLMEDFHIYDISAAASVHELTTAQKHLIEILRAVAGNRRFLILEDFTNIYTVSEMKRFMEILTLIPQKNISIILFSEKSYGPAAESANRLTILQNKTITSIHDVPMKVPVLPASASSIFPSPDMTEDFGMRSSTPFTAYFYTNYTCKKGSRPLSIVLSNHKITGIFDRDWIHCPQITNILYGKSIYTGSLLVNQKEYALKNNVAIINENLSDDNIFYNMNIWDNVGLLLHSHTLSPLGIENRRLTRYYIKDILESLHMEYLIEKYAHMEHMPHVPYDIQMDINIAKWVCKKPLFIVFINPYPENDSHSILERFRKVIFSVQNMGIPCLILSRNKTLQSICDTIINL